MNTRHAKVRAQQRGIPPLIDQWLDQFGCEQYDGRGGIVRFFDSASVRAMERELGRAPVRKMAEFMDAYKVESADNGSTNTTGHRNRHIKRR